MGNEPKIEYRICQKNCSKRNPHPRIDRCKNIYSDTNGTSYFSLLQEGRRIKFSNLNTEKSLLKRYLQRTQYLALHLRYFQILQLSSLTIAEINTSFLLPFYI